MYNIPSVVFPVAQYFLEDVLQITRYIHFVNVQCNMCIYMYHQVLNVRMCVLVTVGLVIAIKMFGIP